MTKPTKAEEQAQIKDWVENIFWAKYPNDLCEGKKGTKANAVKNAKTYFKLIKDIEKEQQRILLNTEAKASANRLEKKAGKFVPRWPYISSYFSAGHFDADLPCISDIKLKIAANICSHEGCNYPVHGGKFDKCTNHFYAKTDTWRNHRKQALTELGLLPKQGEPRAGWSQRCRSLLKEKLGIRSVQDLKTLFKT